MTRRGPASPSRVRTAHRPRAPREPSGDAPGRDVELEVISIAAGGDGVGRTDGLVVFTPRTAPGDRALVHVTPMRGGRFGRGALQDLTFASESRVAPRCVHFTRDRCGGCQLQHLQYETQLAAKGGIVRDALTRIGRRPVSAVVVHPSPAAWGYRRKLTLTLRRAGRGGWVAGLHRYDAPDEIFELRECPITEDGVLVVWRTILDAGDLLPRAAELRAAVRTTEAGYAFVVEGGDEWAEAPAFGAAVPSLTEIWWTPRGAARRRVHREVHGLGRAVSADLAAPRTGASFVQVNADVSSALHAYVVARAEAYAPATAIDAYAGTGATASALARRGVRVTAIETDAEAARQCASSLAGGSRVVTARVEDALAAALPADVVILNPPRQGLSTDVTALLQASAPAPRAIIYVSCDPATLSRDVARLAAWRLVAVESFDMFPQTAHVETVCELLPDGAAGP